MLFSDISLFVYSPKFSEDPEEYLTRAIKSRGLYIFYPIFTDHFFVFKEVFSESSVLMYGLYSRAACNQERLMMVRVRYVKCTWGCCLKSSHTKLI